MDSSLKTIRAQREALDTKKVSARELAEEYIANIKKRDGEIKSYITVTEELALAQANRQCFRQRTKYRLCAQPCSVQTFGKTKILFFPEYLPCVQHNTFEIIFSHIGMSPFFWCSNKPRQALEYLATSGHLTLPLSCFPVLRCILAFPFGTPVYFRCCAFL